jgi:hypothetical protein
MPRFIFSYSFGVSIPRAALRLRRRSVVSIDAGAVIDAQDLNAVGVVVDQVQDSVRAASGAE